MNVREFAGHLVVLGLGSSGMAAAEWGLKRATEGRPVRVTAIDSGAGDVLEARARTLREKGAEVLLGCDDVPRADLIVASPGIRPTSAIMRSAQVQGVPIISEIELAYRISVAPWVAVTGTNGKTTTTALIAHLLREAGYAAEPAGNFGPPAIRVAAEVGTAGVIVAEVSSFQLALTEQFRPRVSVLLNITPDHLDYHGTMEAYTAEKARVFANQVSGDVAVIDIDDEGSAALLPAAEALGVSVLRVSRLRSVRSGGCVRDGHLVLVRDDDGREVLPVAELPIKGDHNVSNALAAACAASAIGADAEAIARGLSTFAPIEHRLEPVGVIDGVEYFNDSKATNPDAVAKALTAFRDRRIVLLLGGRNKGVDLHPLAELAERECAAVVLFGEAADEFEHAFAGLAVHSLRAAGLAQALEQARSIATSGDVVLLSPGCTSFDEFSDYTERGRHFKALVAAAAEGHRP